VQYAFALARLLSNGALTNVALGRSVDAEIGTTLARLLKELMNMLEQGKDKEKRCNKRCNKSFIFFKSCIFWGA
jgi:hypothetical protein